jgi:serine/threonine protein kinase
MDASSLATKSALPANQPLTRGDDELTGEHPSSEESGEEIEIEEHCDYVIDGEKRLPFKSKKILGNGYSAVVEKVQHRRTKEIFARKVIKFPYGRHKLGAEDRFQNEVDIIRALSSHHHIIKLFATYRTTRQGCLLLQPAADEGNLEDYLESYSDVAEESSSQRPRLDKMTRVLEQAFGCLATGLAYMHEKGIRHKDVKPQNILIHQGAVVYTDFGASKDTTKDGQSTTEGLPDFLTRKYSAPEVLDNDKRNYAADVYSLGCVFIEILFALSHRINHGQDQDQDQGFSHIMDNLHTELLTANIPAKLAFLTGTVIFMTMKDPAERPESKAVSRDIGHQEGLFCDQCRPRVRQWHGITMRSGWSERLDPSKSTHSITFVAPHKLTHTRISTENWSRSTKLFQKGSCVCHALERASRTLRRFRFKNHTHYRHVRRNGLLTNPSVCGHAHQSKTALL